MVLGRVAESDWLRIGRWCLEGYGERLSEAWEVVLGRFTESDFPRIGRWCLGGLRRVIG